MKKTLNSWKFMKILKYVKIMKNTKIFQKMPKTKFPKFAKFPKVSKMKVFFAETVAKVSKIKSIWQFHFSKNVSFAKLSKKCQKSKDFSRNYQCCKMFWRKCQKSKHFLKNCQISEQSSSTLGNLFLTLFAMFLTQFWIRFKNHHWTPFFIIQKPKLL